MKPFALKLKTTILSLGVREVGRRITSSNQAASQKNLNVYTSTSTEMRCSLLCALLLLRHHYVKYSHYGKSNFVYFLIMDSH